MLLKSWYDGITEVSAAEADAIGKNFHELLSPALRGAAGLAHHSVAGTTVTCADVTSGDVITSALVAMTAWYSRAVNFATGSEIGGPLDAGLYDLYVDAKSVDLGGGHMEYQAWLRAALAGTLDETIYLVITTASWNGVDTLVMGGGVLTGSEMWGVLDLPRIGRGTWNFVVLGDADRGARFGDLTDIEFGDNVALRFTGPAELVAELGELSINLGHESEILLGTNSRIEAAGENSAVVIGAAAYEQIFGELLLEAGSNAYLRGWAWVEHVLAIDDGGQLMLLDGSTMQFDDGDFSGTPAKNEFTGAAFAKAWAVVSSAGVVQKALNCTVSKPGAAGLYNITFKRNFAVADYHVSPTAWSAGGRFHAEPLSQGVTGFSIQVSDPAGAGQDQRFSFAVFGGDQV